VNEEILSSAASNINGERGLNLFGTLTRISVMQWTEAPAIEAASNEFRLSALSNKANALKLEGGRRGAPLYIIRETISP